MDILLLETGDRVLLETSDFLLLESSGGGATVEDSIALALSESISPVAATDAAAALALGEILAGSFAGLNDAAAAASMAISQAIATNGSPALDVSVELSHTESLALAALNQAAGGFSLEGALALATLADAMHLAGLSLASLRSLSVNAAEVGAVIDVPGCRTVRVCVSVRAVDVPAGKVTVKWEDRRSDAGCC